MKDRELIEKIKTNVIQGRINIEDEGFDEGFEDQPGVVELIEEAVQEGVDVKDIVVDGLTEGMNVVGDNFEKGVYLIPDMLASAEAVGEAMDLLAPHLERSGMESKGRVVLATVKGDLHDIGKNIVAIMLRGAGFEILDLGTDVSSERIIKAVEDHQPKFLGLSALLTTTMREMGNVIKTLEERSIRQSVSVMIGGAPTSPGFSERIGADVHCSDAFQAVEYANSVLAGTAAS